MQIRSPLSCRADISEMVDEAGFMYTLIGVVDGRLYENEVLGAEPTEPTGFGSGKNSKWQQISFHSLCP